MAERKSSVLIFCIFTKEAKGKFLAFALSNIRNCGKICHPLKLIKNMHLMYLTVTPDSADSRIQLQAPQPGKCHTEKVVPNLKAERAPVHVEDEEKLIGHPHPFVCVPVGTVQRM